MEIKKIDLLIFKNNGININKYLQWDFFLCLNKTQNKNYIIYNPDNKAMIENLSIIDLFNFFKGTIPKKLLHVLLLFRPEKVDEDSFNDSSDKERHIEKNIAIKRFVDSKDNQEILNYLVQEHKLLYPLFKDLISILIKVVNDTNFLPIDKIIYEDKGLIYLNKYKKTLSKEIKPNLNAKFYHIEKLIKNICGDQDKYVYFLNFLAYKVQYPLDVPPCHIIIQDDGGTGKSDLLRGDILDRIFEINDASQDDLLSPFNSYMAGVNLVWCEEVEGFEDEKKLKALTGAKWITLNDKYEKLKKIKNYANFIVSSNELRVMKITEKDRRWSVIGGGKRLVPLKKTEWDKSLFGSKKENEKFFNGYHKNIDNEVLEFYSYLLALKVDRNLVQVPLLNDMKENLINMNKTSEISFIDDLINDGIFNVVVESYPKKGIEFFNNFIHKIDSDLNKGYWVKFSDLYELYLQYAIVNQYTKKLTKKAFSMRLKNYEKFEDFFGELKQVKIDNENFKCFKIKSYVDENIEIEIKKEALEI